MAGPPGWESTSYEHFANVAFEYRLERLRARAAAAAIWELSCLSSGQPSGSRELLDGLSEAAAKALLKVTASLRFHSLAKGGRPAASEIESMLLRYPALLD